MEKKEVFVVVVALLLLQPVKTLSCVVDYSSPDGCKDVGGECAKGSGECYMVPTYDHGDQCCCSLDDKCQWILPDSSLVEINDEL